MSDFTYDSKKTVNTAEIYELYEWDNVWIDHANDCSFRRILYIGDSISCGVRRRATALTNEGILFDGFGTSKALDNPFFKDSVKLFMRQLPKIDTVIFNNGLHGWHLDDASDYKNLYEDMVKFLLDELNGNKLFIVFTTSLRDEERNKRVIARNLAAAEIAKKYSLPTIDLYTVTNQNIDMLISDGVHPNDSLNDKIATEIIRCVE